MTLPERAPAVPPRQVARGTGPVPHLAGPVPAPSLYADAHALAALCECGDALASHLVSATGRVGACSLYFGPRGKRCGCAKYKAGEGR